MAAPSRVVEESTQPRKEPPPLFPVFEVKEPGDFPCLELVDVDDQDEEVIALHRELLRRYQASPFYLKQEQQIDGVARYSDVYNEERHKEALKSVLHTSAAWLPKELRQPLPISSLTLEEIASKATESAASPTFSLEEEIPELPYSVLSSPSFALPSSSKDKEKDVSTGSKRKRKSADEEPEKEKETKKRKKSSDSKATQNGNGQSAASIDFSKLKNYKVGELRDYLKEKGINARKMKKQELIDKIEELRSKEQEQEQENMRRRQIQQQKEQERLAAQKRDSKTGKEKEKEKEKIVASNGDKNKVSFVDAVGEKGVAEEGEEQQPVDGEKVAGGLPFLDESQEDEEEGAGSTTGFLSKLSNYDEQEEEETDYVENYDKESDEEEESDDEAAETF
ncbi:hypothetical protein QOT17_001170 [Balamuthia mandrillaris]